VVLPEAAAPRIRINGFLSGQSSDIPFRRTVSQSLHQYLLSFGLLLLEAAQYRLDIILSFDSSAKRPEPKARTGNDETRKRERLNIAIQFRSTKKED